MDHSIKFQPLGPFVLIKRWPQVETHKSGLILPAAARELPQLGRIVAVGSGHKAKRTGRRVPIDLEVGDDVIMEKFVDNDSKIEIDNEALLLVDWRLLYAVFSGGLPIDLNDLKLGSIA